MPFTAEPGFFEPVLWELVSAIGHVLPSEDAHREHLFRGELRLELLMVALSHRGRELITVTLLHEVIDGDDHVLRWIGRIFNIFARLFSVSLGFGNELIWGLLKYQ